MITHTRTDGQVGRQTDRYTDTQTTAVHDQQCPCQEHDG